MATATGRQLSLRYTQGSVVLSMLSCPMDALCDAGLMEMLIYSKHALSEGNTHGKCQGMPAVTGDNHCQTRLLRLG